MDNPSGFPDEGHSSHPPSLSGNSRDEQPKKEVWYWICWVPCLWLGFCIAWRAAPSWLLAAAAALTAATAGLGAAVLLLLLLRLLLNLLWRTHAKHLASPSTSPMLFILAAVAPCCCCCSATLESFPRTVVVFLVVHNLSSLTRSPLPLAGVG